MVDYKRVMGFGVAFGLLSGCGGDGSGTDGDSASSGERGQHGQRHDAGHDDRRSERIRVDDR
jgi:hypothetical protein